MFTKEVIAINTFGEKLKYYRLAANMTQEQLAQKCGLKKQSISRYEKSDREPNIRIASALADALGITLESLVNSGPFHLDIQFFAEKEKPAEIDGQISEQDLKLLSWFRSLPPEKQRAILFSQDAPEGLA